MKLLQYKKNSNKYYGALEKDKIYEINGDIFSNFNINYDSWVKPNEVKILPPVYPSKVVAIGLNYRDHAEELKQTIPDEPILFIKPSTSVIGYDDAIIYPSSAKRVDYEAEIALIVKKKAFKVKKEATHDYILGYTCLNDVTARDLQEKDIQWTRAKSFNTFSPIGPFIETDINPNNVNIYSRLNGELRQSSNTKNFIFNVFELFEFISNIMTLLPGDIITTGTPSGIGSMQPGDVIEIELEGIGILRNRVTKDS